MEIIIKIIFAGTLALAGLGGLMVMLGDMLGNKTLSSDGWPILTLGVILFIVELIFTTQAGRLLLRRLFR
jgi:hypothetical protein